jgi:recombination protein RecA
LAQSRINFDKLFGKEIIDMSDQPLDERLKRAQQFLNTYKKNVAKKGSAIVADFVEKLPDNYQSFPRLNLGIPSLDMFFGGGIPMGGLITCAGDTSVGKTTFLLRLIAAAQRQGKLCLLADAEGTFDVNWARKQGVNTEQLVVIQPASSEGFTPTTLEDYWNGIIDAANSGVFDLFGIDSLDAMIARGRLQSKAGKERDLDDADVALKARVLSDAYPRVLGACRQNASTIFQIAQLRTSGIGGPFVSLGVSGGNARKYYDLLTLHIRRGSKAEAPTDESGIVGFKFHIECKKSKVSGIREGDNASTMFFFEKGFDPEYELTVIALDRGIIKRKGNAAAEYVDLKGNTHVIRVGKDYKIAEFMRENGLINDLRAQVTGELPDDSEPAIVDVSVADEDEPNETE